MKKALVLALFALAGCGEEAPEWESFAAGDFQLTTVSVEDSCMDGLFDLLFMPAGEPDDWTMTTEFPSWESLPTSYDIELPAPYSTMAMSVEGAADGIMNFSGGQQTAVLLDESQWPGCTVDMEITATFTVNGADAVSGSISMDTANYTGDNCPSVQADPCSVTLGLEGARAQ